MSYDKRYVAQKLLTNLEMAQADRLTIAGCMAGIGLMENAGMAVAEAVAARRGARQPGRCGGWARQQRRRRFRCGAAAGRARLRVDVLLVGDPARLKGDAALAANKVARRRSQPAKSGPA